MGADCSPQTQRRENLQATDKKDGLEPIVSVLEVSMIKTYIGIASFPATSQVDPCSPSPCGPFSNCVAQDTKAECSCMAAYQVSCDWSPV